MRILFQFPPGVHNTSSMDHMLDVRYNTSHQWKPSSTSASSHRTTSMIPMDDYNTPRSSSYKSPLQTGDCTLSLSSSLSTANVRSFMKISSPSNSMPLESASVYRVIGAVADQPPHLDQFDAPGLLREDPLCPPASLHQGRHLDLLKTEQGHQRPRSQLPRQFAHE